MISKYKNALDAANKIVKSATIKTNGNVKNETNSKSGIDVKSSRPGRKPNIAAYGELTDYLALKGPCK